VGAPTDNLEPGIEAANELVIGEEPARRMRLSPWFANKLLISAANYAEVHRTPNLRSVEMRPELRALEAKRIKRSASRVRSGQAPNIRSAPS
jgi:hypothetical protein